MADFKKFWPVLRENEGGLTVDDGGLTWRGVSEKSFPGWDGFPVVKALVARYGKPLSNQDEYNAFTVWVHGQPEYANLEVLAQNFYKPVFWDVIQGDKIGNQVIANYIADWGVNCGVKMAIGLVQKVLGVTIDHDLGNGTLQSLNAKSGEVLFTQLVANRTAYYKSIAINPKLTKYLPEWLRRANSFTFSK